MYIIANYYKPHTSRGSNGHDKCPYCLRLADDKAEAEETLISKAILDHEVVVDGYMLFKDDKLIWQSGDNEIDMGEYYVKIHSMKEFIKYANLNPDSSHSKLGAIREGEFRDLFE